MIHTEIVQLPQIAVIGKEGLCTAESNTVQQLWAETNSHFSEVAELGMREPDGSYVGFWGAMSDEARTFAPWTDGFRRGLYLAGIEVYADTPVPDGWTKWILPARTWLVTDVEEATYGDTFRTVLQEIIPQRGLELSGAVCDYTKPATGKNKLFFPVREK